MIGLPSIPGECFLAFILLIIGLYYYFTWNHGYWEKLGVAHVKPSNIIFGNLGESFMAKKTIGECIKDIYWQLDGLPFGGYFRVRNPVLMIRDADLLRTMLVRDFNSFHDNLFPINEDLDPLFARNPFILTGDRWKRVRSQLSPAFSGGKIRPMFPLMREVTEELSTFLKKEAPLGRPDGLDVKETCAKYTTDVVASCAFGVRCNSLQNPDAEMRQMGRKILEPSLMKSMQLTLRFFFPLLADIFRIRFVPVEVHQFFLRIVREAIAYREKNSVTRNDFLQLLMQLKNKGHVDGAGEGLPKDSIYTDLDVTAHVVAFLTDGFETSSVAMSFALYDLAVNPHIQDRLRDDLEESLKKHGGELTYEVIQDTPYLDMVLSETLRLHPPGLFLEKKCTQPYQMTTPTGKTFTLEKNMSVVLPILALHTDPKYFPDPEQYDPERFSDENKNGPGKQAYMPFGVGPRMCIGMRFAVSQVKMGIAAVVRDFTIKPTPRTPIPIVLDPKYFMYGAKGGLWLDFVPRNVS